MIFYCRKKNFDEIDWSGFHRFAKRPYSAPRAKKNFDEIDRVGFGGFYF